MTIKWNKVVQYSSAILIAYIFIGIGLLSSVALMTLGVIFGSGESYALPTHLGLTILQLFYGFIISLIGFLGFIKNKNWGYALLLLYFPYYLLTTLNEVSIENIAASAVNIILIISLFFARKNFSYTWTRFFLVLIVGLVVFSIVGFSLGGAQTNLLTQLK